MHFFYIDESGDTGNNLADQNQPIFVLGGLSVADKKWNNTKEQLDEILSEYMAGNLPAGFELHANELLSPNGEGHFAGHPIQRRLELVERLLALPDALGHHVHLFAIDKAKTRLGELSIRDCLRQQVPVPARIRLSDHVHAACERELRPVGSRNDRLGREGGTP